MGWLCSVGRWQRRYKSDKIQEGKRKTDISMDCYSAIININDTAYAGSSYPGFVLIEIVGVAFLTFIVEWKQ